MTLVQDAHFLYPEKDAQGIKETIVIGVDDDGEEITVEGFYLEGNQVGPMTSPMLFMVMQA